MNHSNLYSNAPLPFMQRLTWDGIALHAGKIPGYAVSHGCIRLPLAFVKKLYAETERGGLVVVADDASFGPAVVYPGVQPAVDAYSGEPIAPVDNNAVYAGSPQRQRKPHTLRTTSHFPLVAGPCSDWWLAFSDIKARCRLRSRHASFSPLHHNGLDELAGGLRRPGPAC